MERDRQWRYIVAFSDGGAGPRFYDQPITDGHEIRDSGHRYRLSNIMQPARPGVGGGSAHANLIE